MTADEKPEHKFRKDLEQCRSQRQWVVRVELHRQIQQTKLMVRTVRIG